MRELGLFAVLALISLVAFVVGFIYGYREAILNILRGRVMRR